MPQVLMEEMARIKYKEWIQDLKDREPFLTAPVRHKPDKFTRIIVTQPRRVAAISVAERVAFERGQARGAGGRIGYHVRFDKKDDQHQTELVYIRKKRY